MIRLHGDLGGRASLSARWTVRDKNGKALAMKRSNLSRPVAADDYPAFVAAASDMVAELSRQIAAAIPNRD